MKYEVVATTAFKKELRKIKKRRKDLIKLKQIVDILSNGETPNEKYKDHKLVDTPRFKNCRELHIAPD